MERQDLIKDQIEKLANNLFLIAKDLDVVESKNLYQKSLKIL